MLSDSLVHQRLGEHRVIDFVVAVSSVAYDIDNDVFFESLSELCSDSGNVNDGVAVVSVDVENGRTYNSGDICAVRTGS